MVYVAQDGDDVVSGVYASLHAAMRPIWASGNRDDALLLVQTRKSVFSSISKPSPHLHCAATGSSLSTADRRASPGAPPTLIA